MEYDDFGDKFWPLLGERVYETDHEIVKQIFAKAIEVLDGNQQKEALRFG